jgi:hypothetical protein
MFMCRSTRFGRLHAYHQELTAALTASAFTFEHGGSSVVSHGLAGQPARPRPTTLLPPRSKVKPEAVNAAVTPDDGRGGARNVLSDT